MEAEQLQREVASLRSKLSSAKTDLEGATNELKYARKEKVMCSVGSGRKSVGTRTGLMQNARFGVVRRLRKTSYKRG